MADLKWSIKAREFVNCNCSYGCPCQFNGRPSYGNCEVVAAMQIDEGIHGTTTGLEHRITTHAIHACRFLRAVRSRELMPEWNSALSGNEFRV